MTDCKELRKELEAMMLRLRERQKQLIIRENNVIAREQSKL